jgi:hypothetical protein
VNWSKVAVAGVGGGVVHTLANYVMHGVIMANTYTKYPEVFRQADNPTAIYWFFVVGALTGITACVLFAKTRESWDDGFMGGAGFGFWVGLVVFTLQFYPTMVIEGFPYYLSWCWGGIDLIGFTILGGMLGVMYKRD